MNTPKDALKITPLIVAAHFQKTVFKKNTLNFLHKMTAKKTTRTRRARPILGPCSGFNSANRPRMGPNSNTKSMTVKYIADLIYGTVKPVNVTDWSDTSYRTIDGARRLRSTKTYSVFSTELDAKRFIAMQLSLKKKKALNDLHHAKVNLLDALLRFNLEQCEVCNEFHTAGEEHDCERHPF